MPYIDKKHGLILLLLGWGPEHARKYATEEEINEAKNELAKQGWKYGRCQECGDYWFIKQLRYRIRKPRSKTWITFAKILCPSCRGRIMRQAERSRLTEALP